jgi:DNA-binding MarR family transcriptional regulator
MDTQEQLVRESETQGPEGMADRLPGARPAPAYPLDGSSGGPCPVSDERITLMGLLVETHAHLTRVLGAELEQACAMPLTWFDVLIRLARSPDEHLTMTQLASEVSLTSGGITRLVDRIAEAGYVERQSCATDRRSVYVALTPAGRAKMEEAIAVHVAGLDRHLLAPLGDEDRAALEVALRKLRSEGGCFG